MSQFITQQTIEQIITIQILPNISRGNGNQTMKLGQLIEYSVRNTFLEKYIKCGKESSTRAF